MARTKNEVIRDERNENLLVAILQELKELNKNIKLGTEDAKQSSTR